MAIEWSPAPASVLDTASELIHLYHQDLEDASIGFLMRSEPSMRGSSMVLGEASRVPAKLRQFIDYDAIIWLAAPQWNGLLNEEQRRALLDHELCHLHYDKGIEKLEMVEHDITEFRCILDRYGLWNTDLLAAREDMEKAIQMPLIDFESHRGGGVASLTRVEVKAFAGVE